MDSREQGAKGMAPQLNRKAKAFNGASRGQGARGLKPEAGSLGLLACRCIYSTLPLLFFFEVADEAGDHFTLLFQISEQLITCFTINKTSSFKNNGHICVFKG